MKKIFIILICLLIASPAFAGKKPKKSPLYKLQKQLGNGEIISIPSYSTTSFIGIHKGWYKESPINVEALLTLPPGDGPFPVLMITHSSGGPLEFAADWLEFMRDQQKPLLDLGIGTLYLDNFSASSATNDPICFISYSVSFSVNISGSSFSVIVVNPLMSEKNTVKFFLLVSILTSSSPVKIELYT